MSILDKLFTKLIVKKTKSLNTMIDYNNQSIIDKKEAIKEYKALIADAEDDIIEFTHDNKEINAHLIKLSNLMGI